MPPAATVSSTLKSRKWLFTWNNYPAAYSAFLDQLECRYVCAGEEVAPTTGTPHLQGFVYFRTHKRLGTMRGLFPGCHLLPANGTPVENRLYCGKLRDAGTYPS